jgi:hypothetical protein
MVEYTNKTFLVVLITALIALICTNLFLFLITFNILNLVPIILQAAVLITVLSKMKIQLILIRIWAVLILLSSLTKWMSWLLQMNEGTQMPDFDAFNIILNFIGLLLPIYLLMFLSDSVERKKVQQIS